MRNTSVPIAALALVLAGASGPELGAAGDSKALEVLAAARKAIGDRTLDGLKTFSVEALVQRNIGNMQLNSETEILLDLPDKYLRSDVPSGGMMSATMTSGFNGGVAIRPAGASMAPGGRMVIRMGPGGPAAPAEKLTPAQQEEMDRMMLRSARTDVSRLMLGWFAMAHPAIDAEYVYAGEAESPDGKAHVIDVKNADGFAARLFVDQRTRLPLMVTYQAPPPRVVTSTGRDPEARRSGGHAGEPTDEERRKAREEAEKAADLQNEPDPAVEHTLYFEDWQAAGGVRFPHKIRRAVAGTTSEEWTVNKVKVNPRIDPKKFQG